MSFLIDLAGGFQHFFIIIPKIGEMIPNLTSICFRWVVPPPTSHTIMVILFGRCHDSMLSSEILPSQEKITCCTDTQLYHISFIQHTFPRQSRHLNKIAEKISQGPPNVQSKHQTHLSNYILGCLGDFLFGVHISFVSNNCLGGGFILFIFTPIWGKFPIWLIFLGGDSLSFIYLPFNWLPWLRRSRGREETVRFARVWTIWLIFFRWVETTNQFFSLQRRSLVSEPTFVHLFFAIPCLLGWLSISGLRGLGGLGKTGEGWKIRCPTSNVWSIY